MRENTDQKKRSKYYAWKSSKIRLLETNYKHSLLIDQFSWPYLYLSEKYLGPYKTSMMERSKK